MYLFNCLTDFLRKEIFMERFKYCNSQPGLCCGCIQKKISKTAAVIIFLLIAVAVCFILFILGDTSKYLRYVLGFGNVFMNFERQMILKSYFFVSFYPKNYFTSQCSIYVLSRRILGMIYFILVCSHVWAIHVCCSGRCAITYLHFP